jgi:hypothetical protein
MPFERAAHKPGSSPSASFCTSHPVRFFQDDARSRASKAKLKRRSV